MKLKTAVYYAAMFLQLDSVCSALETETEITETTTTETETNGETETTETETNGETETKSEIDILLGCANLVLGEIASDYVPLVTREKVNVDESKELQYSRLSKPIIDVYSVRKLTGESVKTRQYFDRIEFPREGEYEVEYSYMPSKMGLEDELPYTERVSARAIGYGIACEYSIVSGMTDDAVLWDKRYKDALHSAETKKTEKRVPARRWL